MIKYFSFLFIVVTFSFVSVSFAQTISITPYGISPRDAEKSENDIFDRRYNALLNVGTETQMYLKASKSDGNLTSGNWLVVEKPAGSNAAFGLSTNVPINASAPDAASSIIIFTPDIPGKYVVQFADGNISSTITINAGTYIGMEGSCVLCHSDKADSWKDTGHSEHLVRGLNGTLSSHYNESCIKCHTVGYDPDASNDGFDDFDFVFPDTLFVGQYDNMVTAYPEAMKRANIQCESCHGPGSEHNGNKTDNKIAVSINAEVCSYCHDEGNHHFRPEEWDRSGHANPPTYPTGAGRASCARCHTPEGFMEYVDGEEVTEHEWAPFSCAMCHDPHSNNGEYFMGSDRHQLRTVSATLSNGFVVENGGNGKLCMNCHQSRQNAEEYTKSRLTSNSSHFGPHYMTQADMFNATNVATFGYTLPSSPHIVAVKNSCADCHMASSHPESGIPLVGDHTFSMVDLESGVEHVEVCQECHGDIGETFDEKKYYDSNFNADHDGDGVEEGVHDEVEGLLEELASLLPAAEGHDAYDPHDPVTPDFSLAEVKAAFNYEMVYYDRSHGLHNPAFTVALLKVSIEALKYGIITAGEIQSVADVPNDQGYQVRLVWTKFGADDGVAPDQVKSYTILRKVENTSLQKAVQSYTSISQIPSDIGNGQMFKLNGDMWDVVQSVEALQFGEYSAVVPTLKNAVEGDTSMTTFKVLGKTAAGMIAETTPMSGYSIDNLAPAVPTGVILSAVANGVKIDWDESVDSDFNYFTVYRMIGSPDISQKEFVASITSNSFTDMNVPSGGNVYYSVSAFDYSNNESGLTDPQTLGVTGVESEEGMPTAYKLYSNYPNPFNPETNIKYSIPQSGLVNLTIFNSLGQEVAVLVNEIKGSGYYTVSFNASNFPSGVYYYRITANEYTQTKKMVLLK